MTVTETHYFYVTGHGTIQIGAVTSIIDADGQRTKLTYPNGRYVTYSYDGVDRVNQITDDDSTVLVDYDYKGYYVQDRKLNGDALRLTFKDQADLDGYDAFGRIAWMRHYDTSGPTDVVKLAYGHDYASSPRYEEDLVNANMDQLYGYDALHRLTSFQRGNLNQNKDAITDNPPPREQSWTLQHVGNWDGIVSKTNGTDDHPYDTRTHNTVNEITQIDPQGAVGQFAVVSDDAENLKELPDRTDVTKADRYTYDYRNRLVKVERSDDYDEETPAWSTVVEYYYDGGNRRVKKDLPGEGIDVIFLYDGWRCIEEQELDGETWEARRQFVYGGLYIDEVLLSDKDTDDDGECTDAGGSTRYLYCANNNFNVMALTEADGAVVERVKYDPYGQPTCIRTSDSHEQTASHFDNPYLFQGQRYDRETGLYYFKNRYYSPTLGRFLQRDAMSTTADSLYAFGSNAPLLTVDPLGWVTLEWGKGWRLELDKNGGTGSYSGGPNLTLDLPGLNWFVAASVSFSGSVVATPKPHISRNDCNSEPHALTADAGWGSGIYNGEVYYIAYTEVSDGVGKFRLASKVAGGSTFFFWQTTFSYVGTSQTRYLTWLEVDDICICFEFSQRTTLTYSLKTRPVNIFMGVALVAVAGELALWYGWFALAEYGQEAVVVPAH